MKEERGHNEKEKGKRVSTIDSESIKRFIIVLMFYNTYNRLLVLLH